MAWELIKDEKSKSSWFYIGPVEEAEFEVTLPPEQIPGNSYFVNSIVSKLSQKVEGEGCELLETKIYYDPGTFWNCKYKIVSTARRVGGGGIGQIGLGPLVIPWSVIILAVLIVVAIGLIAWSLNSVKDKTWFGPAILIGGIGILAIGVALLIKSVRNKANPKYLRNVSRKKLK